MNLSNLAPPSMDRWLFQLRPEYKSALAGQRRNAFGAIAQEVACAALDLIPIPINGNFETCFDAKNSDGLFFEIKSCKPHGKSPIYKFRLQRESEYSSVLRYVFVLRHGNRDEDPWDQFSSVTILDVPFGCVNKVAAKCALKRHKTGGTSRDGYNRIGYRDGYYNVPIDRILNAVEFQRRLEFKLYGKTHNATILTRF